MSTNQFDQYQGLRWGLVAFFLLVEFILIGVGIKGSITPGKLADLVMLAADPNDTAADEIKNIPVVRTLVGGNTVYEA